MGVGGPRQIDRMDAGSLNMAAIGSILLSTPLNTVDKVRPKKTAFVSNAKLDIFMKMVIVLPATLESGQVLRLYLVLTVLGANIRSMMEQVFVQIVLRVNMVLL